MKKPFLLLFPITGLFLLTPFLSSAQEQPFGDRVVLRGRLENSRIQFERTGKGRVAFMGGSITEMNGYRPMVCEILQSRFPDTEFNFISAGISSTTSTTGAFRLERDVLSNGPVDIFFIEFAVNDDQDGHYTRAECIRGMEGIIRHARRQNPDIDIVVTYFVNEGMLRTYDDGKTPLSINAHEAVVEHYDVPSIKLAREVWLQMKAGDLTWQEYGGVHPAPAGNRICARMIDELFHRAWTMPLPLTADAAIAPHPVPAEPLDQFNYSNGRFIDPSTAEFDSDWTLGIPDWAALPGSKRSRFTAIPMLVATEPGAELTLKFEGTAVGAYIVAGPDAGMVEASVDDSPGEVIDLYHDYSKGLHYPRTVMFGTELAPGPHTLRLRVIDRTRSAGHAMRIMKFAAN